MDTHGGLLYSILQHKWIKMKSFEHFIRFQADNNLSNTRLLSSSTKLVSALSRGRLSEMQLHQRTISAALILCQLVSSLDHPRKKFVPRQNVGPDMDSNCLTLFLKDIFEKKDFKRNQQATKCILNKSISACKKLNEIYRLVNISVFNVFKRIRIWKVGLSLLNPFKKWIHFLECSWNHEYFGSRAK